MQIVIDIPKDAYKEIYNGQFDTGGYFKANLRDAFRHGTPLPNGHGRLIDADKARDDVYWGKDDKAYFRDTENDLEVQAFFGQTANNH